MQESQPEAPKPVPSLAGLWFRREQIDEDICILEAERALITQQISAILAGGAA